MADEPGSDVTHSLPIAPAKSCMVGSGLPMRASITALREAAPSSSPAAARELYELANRASPMRFRPSPTLDGEPPRAASAAAISACFLTLDGLAFWPCAPQENAGITIMRPSQIRRNAHALLCRTLHRRLPWCRGSQGDISARAPEFAPSTFA